MLTATEIRRLAYDNTYRRGKVYYQEGLVKKIDVHWAMPGTKQATEVEGEVRGSGRRSYEASLMISADDEITDYSCTCPAYDSYWGMCKHCVALALAFQEEQKKHRSVSLPGRTGIRRETSQELLQLLQAYAKKGRMHRLGGLDHEVEVECYFQTDRNGLLLEMKLGSKRKYVVKNLVKLVRDVQEIRTVRYGSNLEFTHDQSAFTEEAWQILELLERAVVERFPDYRDSYYEMSSNFRYLLLRGESLEGFLDHFLGRGIRLDEQDVPVREGDPDLFLSLSETTGGAELTAERLSVWEGVRATYARKDHAIWRVTPSFAAQVLPVWQALLKLQGASYRKKSLFLSRADYGSFCAHLLPLLKDKVEIRSGSLDLAAYAPAEPEFTMWLGMPEENVLEAAARVRYDDQDYDLLGSMDARASRNLESELEVRSLLKRYFKETGVEEIPRPKTGRRKSSLEWLDGVPVRDLDVDDGRGAEWDRNDSGEYGLPVRDLDEDLAEESYVPWGGITGGSEEEEGETTDGFSLPAGYQRLYAIGEEAVYDVLEEGLSELSRAGELLVDEAMKKLSVRPAPKVSMGIGIAGELIDLDIHVEGMDWQDIADILGAYRRKRRFFRLKNGDFLRLGEGGLADLSELSEGLALTGEELEDGHVQLPMYRALYLEGVLRDAEGASVKRAPEYRSLIRSMRSFSDSDFELPDGLQAELRKYQKEGFRWLCTLSENGFGGILADDMGLGKTLQMIALLLYLRGPVRRFGVADTAENGHVDADGTSVAGLQSVDDNPSLVVAPASLVYNWESEIARFAPSLSVQVIAGTAAERQEQIGRSGEYDVNITSYDLLKRDIDSYAGHPFLCCVADEAQYIKNAGTQAARAVKQVAASHRFAMTGTPIENRLSDLWSIFDFLMPGYLFAYRKFRDELESPIVKEADEAASRRLQRLVTPFILRRRKGDVLKDLPDKLEETVTVRMSPEQEKVYRASTERLRRELLHKNEQEIRESRLQILAELTRLRQLCCSPELCYENYSGGSGKVDACLELLRNAVESGHRVLVFSQFTTMLELLQREWKRAGGGKVLYLSGKDSKLARKKMVEDFQLGETPIFFISLKAGGTGLNLTAADIVIHVDPWWNVAAQNQATDRAHRIGQKNVVSVMKLVAKDSIEEKILRLQEKKAALADSVVEGEGVRDITLNREELLELF